MLPAGSRLRRSADFAATVRTTRGSRAAGLVVVHCAAGDTSGDRRIDQPSPPARVGFVVSRSVGPAVVRNRVRRRLRHLVAADLGRLPPGSRLVIRALPASAAASYDELAAALRKAVDRALATSGAVRAVRA